MSEVNKTIKFLESSLDSHRACIADIENELARLKAQAQPSDLPHFERPGDFGILKATTGPRLWAVNFAFDRDVASGDDPRDYLRFGNLFDLMDPAQGGGPYVMGLTKKELEEVRSLVIADCVTPHCGSNATLESLGSKIRSCLARTDKALGISK